MSAVRHHLAIDLAEHFQRVPRGGVHRRHWHRFPSRLEENCETALRLLEKHGAKATFFVDGWIATRHGDLVARIARHGHEIAAYLSEDPQPDATVRSLEAATKLAVQGCRYVTRDGGSASIDVAKCRLRYALASRNQHASVSGARIVPEGGFHESGEFLRLLPGALVSAFVLSWTRSHNARTFSFGIWELDPECPKLATLDAATRVRAYRNLPLFAERLDRLLESARFTSLADGLGLDEKRVAPAQIIAAQHNLPTRGSQDGAPVSIVIPCFNEEPGLGYLANALKALDAGFGSSHRLSFILVDDGSSDGTWLEMQRLFGDDSQFRLARHDRNRGIGAAILTGLLAAPDELVAVMDSDCSYDPGRLEEMLPLLEPDVALVTASPYHRHGDVEGVPEWRLVLSRGASRLYRKMLRNKLATYTSCFRIYRKSAVARLALRHEGYIGVVEMLARLDLEGWRIAEFPIVLEARLLGQSKLRIVRTIAQHLSFMCEILMARVTERTVSGEPRVTSQGE